jgi:hypothetical protein
LVANQSLKFRDLPLIQQRKTRIKLKKGTENVTAAASTEQTSIHYIPLTSTFSALSFSHSTTKVLTLTRTTTIAISTKNSIGITVSTAAMRSIGVISIFCVSVYNVAAWTGGSVSVRPSTSRLYHAPPAPKHDVGGGNPMADYTPEQLARAQAYMEHQNNVPKPGFPVDVRSLVQYNHGFAVMSTNSKL